jgi:hypothetical protein
MWCRLPAELCVAELRKSGEYAGCHTRVGVLAQEVRDRATGLGTYKGHMTSCGLGLNDLVSFQGSSYISLVTENQGNPPSTSVGKWGVMALGRVGIQGQWVNGSYGPPDWPAGPTGAPGLQSRRRTRDPGLVYQGYSSAKLCAGRRCVLARSHYVSR